MKYFLCALMLFLLLTGKSVSAFDSEDTCSYDPVASAVDLGICDTVRLGCPTYALNVAPGDSFAIPLYWWHDEPISGFSLGFKYNNDFVEITSWDVNTSIIPTVNFKLSKSVPDQNTFLTGWVDLSGSQAIPPSAGSGGDLFGTLYMRVLPGATSATINLDSTYVDPSGYFEMVANLSGNFAMRLFPQYADCGDSDVVITVTPSDCGDIDGSGETNLSDVVFVVNYLFAGGAAPSPLSLGDLNCDGKINLSDAVALVNYIFGSGPSPCAGCNEK